MVFRLIQIIYFGLLVTSSIDGFNNNVEGRVSNDITSEVAKLIKKVKQLIKAESLMKEELTNISKGVHKNSDSIKELSKAQSLTKEELTDVGKVVNTNAVSIEELKKIIASFHRTTPSPSPRSTAPTSAATSAAPTTLSKLVYYPPGTTDHQALRHYPKYGLDFIGYGFGHYDEASAVGTGTFEKCIARCHEKREDEGHSWNGLAYWWRDGLCVCYDKDYGQQDFENSIHYRFRS